MYWKYSQFNLLDQMGDGRYSIYNTKTQRHFILQQSIVDLLQEGSVINKLPEKLLNKFIHEGMVVAEAVDEIAELRQQSFTYRCSDKHGLVVAILPTLTCNFRCKYCFENLVNDQASQFMNESTQDNLINFVTGELADGDKELLYIKWFGGEPLLAEDVMLALSIRLQQVAKKYGKRYLSALTTNGYFLDKLTPEKIAQLGLFAIQVTLDGPPAVHNQRRPHVTDPDPFSRIITNLSYLREFFNNIFIRISVDTGNASTIPQLFAWLQDKHLLGKFKYYLGYIEAETGKYSLDPYCSQGLQQKDVIASYHTILAGMKNLGVAEKFLLSKYPKSRMVACDAQLKNSYVINPAGDVFKCLNDATITARRIFNINSREQSNSDREQQFLQDSPYELAECTKCALLPICQGGCPAKRIDLDANKSYCWPYCETMREQLIRKADELL